jgi:fructosamine-3-kinase
MNLHSIEHYLKQIISEKVQTTLTSLEFSSVGGGSINETYKIKSNNNDTFFLKLNSALAYPSLFDNEKKGLEFLAAQKILRTPAIIYYGTVDDYQLLLLEWIEPGIKTNLFWQNFGEQLSLLHKKSNPYFGFAEKNYMGALTQSNDYTKSWNDFFIRHRLQPQMRLAADNGKLSKQHILQFEILYKKLPSIFNEESASLLHGDLWSGNFMCDQRSQPVIIDPAVYFGHRSMDLAMTTLFGGVDKSFYEAYQYHFPLPDNYREQWSVCNLYPLLVHLNLFGSSYLYDIEAILKKFIH